jgi:hypothetical protein
VHVKNKWREYCYSVIVACQPCFFFFIKFDAVQEVDGMLGTCVMSILLKAVPVNLPKKRRKSGFTLLTSGLRLLYCMLRMLTEN